MGPGGATGFCDVEPLSLPLLHCLHKNTFRPGDVGKLSHHGSSAFRVLAVYHLRLHIEDFEPQPEVGVDAEEGLAHDDERRDVEEGIRG